MWRPVEPSLDPAVRRVHHELWRRGDLSFLLHDTQLRMREHLAKFNDELVVPILCPRQIGKSYFGLSQAVENCLNNPGWIAKYGAPSKGQAIEISGLHLENVLATCPYKLRPKKRANKYHFPNGSQLWIVGCDHKRGDLLRGTAADEVWLDEARDVGHLEYLINSVILPQFTTRPHGQVKIITTPPKSPGHAMTRIYVRHALEGNYMFRATWRDNPFHAPGWLDKILKKFPGGMQDPQFRNEHEADYTASEEDERVVPGWSAKPDDQFFDNEWRMPALYQPWISIDPGFQDHTAILCAMFDPRSATLCIIDEHVKRQMRTDEIAAAIKKLEAKHFTGKNLPPVKRISDIDPRMLADLAMNHNLIVAPTHKNKSNTTMLAGLRTSLHQGQIRIHPTCKRLRFELETLVWNKGRTDYERMEDGGHGDALSSLKYLNMMVDWRWMPSADVFGRGQPVAHVW